MSTDAHTDGSAILRAGASLGLVVAAVVVATAGGLLIIGAAAAFGLDSNVELVLNFLLSQAAFVVVAVVFLTLVASEGLVNARVPDSRDLLTVAGALGVAIAAETVRQLAVRFTDLSNAGTVSLEEDIAVWALVAVLLMVVLVAPIVEELFFRGIVQGWVAEASSARAGIAVATVLFVPIHAAQTFLVSPTITGALSVFAVLTVVSIVLGVAYARTDNIVVPMSIHAAYNGSSALVPYVVHDLTAAGLLPVG